MAELKAQQFLETPQQVMQRLAEQRQKAMGSGNPLETQQAVLGQILDNLFGSPEVKRSRMLQEKVAGALKSMPADGDELTQEMYKLRAIRDAYADIGDVDNASAANIQLLKVGQMQLEQRKLKADIDRTEGEEQRDDANAPFVLGKNIADANQYEPWMDPRTGAMTSVHAADGLTKEELRQKGYVPAGKPTLQGGKDDVTGLTKPVTTKLQEDLIGADQQLFGLRQMIETYDPQYTQYLPQLAFAGGKYAEKAGIPLPAAAQEKIAAYNEWRANTSDFLSRYVKFITGAQMAVKEIERIEQGVPTVGDSHSQYTGKLRRTVKSIIAVHRRAETALARGLDPNSFPLAEVSDAEVDEFLGPLASAAPAVDTSGEAARRLRERAEAARRASRNQ